MIYTTWRFRTCNISYPLSPNSPASDSIPHLERFYKTIASQYKHITFMGDSAGGNIALVLGLYAASEALKEGIECPVRNIFAISPAVDHRNENPEIDAVAPHDSILSRKVIEEVSEGWKGAWSPSDPRVSPILANLGLLRRANIKVDGVVGKYDVLSPDALHFRNLLAEAGVSGDWLEWEKQLHCFPLMFPYHVHEGVAAKDWILEILRRNAHL